MRLIAVACAVGAGAVRDEDKVILDEVYCLLLAVADVDYLLCDYLAALVCNDDIFNVHAVLDAHAVRLKVFDKRQYKALVLIVLSKAQCAEIGKSVDMVNIAAEIALHLKRARITLESEHRLPVEPEIRAPE